MRSPLLYATLPFAVGIIAQRESLVFVLLLLLFYAARQPWVVISFAAMGFVMSAITENRSDIPYNQPIEIVARIETTPTIKGRWQRTVGDVVSFKDSTGAWQEADQKMQIYADTSAKIELGNTIYFTSKQYGIYPYFMSQGIMGRAYCYRLKQVASDTTLFERAILLRNHLSSRLAEIGTSTANTALIQALALGDKSGIDREQRAEYNRAGAAHLLAVSGLHVGIVFLILSYLLGWIKLFRNGLNVYCLVIIMLLWGYAMLTGFSPSVLRAVLMFSLYQIGVMISRTSNNLNTLLAAGLILLVINPNYLYDIGFQLSFSAMFGIVLFYKPICSLWHNPVWRLAAVTLAAQIAVLPLSCYYFGNVPLFGIFVNLALWAIVPAIIGLAFLYLLTGWGLAGTMCAVVAGWQNDFVTWSASHSWIAVENIVMPLMVCVVIYAVMFIGVRILLRRRTVFPNR